MVDEIMLEAEEGMEKAIDSLKTAFASVRTGRANAMVLDKIRVDYYGVPTPINQMAAIKTPDAHLLVIEPWDKGILGGIEHAILQSNIGIMPSNDGTCLRLPFPALTEERRREYVKQCKTYSEEARVRIRAVRRDANEDLEKAVIPVIPMGQLIQPEDIADTILFLASEKARMLTGQVIKVSGGHAL